MNRRLPRGEFAAFALAAFLVAIRLVDDELVQPPSGTSLTDHPAALLVPLAVAAGTVAVYRRLRPGFRSLICMSFGMLALVGGVIAVATMRIDGFHGSVWSGLLLLPAGVALIVLAGITPWRERRTRAAGWRRFRNQVLATAAVPLLLFFAVMPVGVALWTTHKFHTAIGALGVAHQDVTLRTSDGLRLSGWYIPSRNHAAVVIVHGGGGDRMGARRHALMLANAGYGVLLYDARGRGASQGAPDAYGWTWGADVDAAVRFLEHRRGVDPRRIGAVGLSTGADVLVEYVARHHEVRAVVADGTTARSVSDTKRILQGGDLLTLPYWWAQYAAARVLSGGAPGKPLAELAAHARPTRILFIASSWSVERAAAPVYARAAREPHDLWRVDAGHTGGLEHRPAAYTSRVTRFLRATLLRPLPPRASRRTAGGSALPAMR